MIGKIAKAGNGFGGLIRYLEHGTKGDEFERCAWIESRNLPTADSQAAMRIMRATANQNGRCENPVYHFSLSWDRADPFDMEQASAAVDHALDSLGLRDHQALVFCHTDRPHPHVHVVVNKVHPETAKVWRNGHDFARLEKACREIERDYGLRVVEGHHAQLDGQERPDERSKLSDGEKQEKERTGSTFKEEIQEIVTASLG